MLLPLRRLMAFSLVSLDAPLAAEQVSISLSTRFNCRVHPDASVAQQAALTWTELKTKQPRLFNASKFRLHALHASSSALQMDWGLTDYASYLGTCCSALAPRLLEDGAKHGDKFAYLSRKVGVAAVLETRDGHVALIRRSKSVGLYQDLLDTPGGHPEPSHIHLTEDTLQTLEEEEEDGQGRRALLEHAATKEFFESIANEIHEEVNVAPQIQQPPKLLGVVMQTDACTPSFSFHVKAECSAEEMRELYRAGPSDKFESVELEILPAEELLAEGATMLDELQLTPSAKGTLGLWKQHTLRAREQQ